MLTADQKENLYLIGLNAQNLKKSRCRGPVLQHHHVRNSFGAKNVSDSKLIIFFTFKLINALSTVDIFKLYQENKSKFDLLYTLLFAVLLGSIEVFEF